MDAKQALANLKSVHIVAGHGDNGPLGEYYATEFAVLDSVISIDRLAQAAERIAASLELIVAAQHLAPTAGKASAWVEETTGTAPDAAGGHRMNYTPGPWTTGPGKGSIAITARDWETPLVARVSAEGHSTDMALANSRLLAAAPDLHRMLDEVFDFLSSIDEAVEIRERILTVLNRAET